MNLVLENWKLIRNKNPNIPPETQKCTVIGEIYNHPKINDGQIVKTTNVKDLNEELNFVTTHDSIYELGSKHPEYENWLKTNKLEN